VEGVAGDGRDFGGNLDVESLLGVESLADRKERFGLASSYRV
jgi:hypothetical protein